MRRDDIDEDLQAASFEFFFWFSRFEFALKENKFLKRNTVGAPAEPSWQQFHQKYGMLYAQTEAARTLLRLHPKQQIIGANELSWEPVDVSNCKTVLCEVVYMLKTVRNNLFHGGKHGDRDVDDKWRNLQLLRTGKLVLDELAQLAQLEADYMRYY